MIRHIFAGFHLEGGAGGKLPPQKKKRRKEKRGERERERERGKWERGGGSIYLGIMIYVSNISLIITNIKLI